MFIVIRDWGDEVAIDKFETESSAMAFINEWKEFTEATIYLTKLQEIIK